MLLFSCSQVFCRNVNNTVCINVKRNFNLRNTARCCRNAYKVKISERAVLSRHLTFTLKNVD